MTGASRARDSPHGVMGTRLLDTPSDVPSNSNAAVLSSAVRRFAGGPARLPAATSGVRPRTPRGPAARPSSSRAAQASAFPS